MGSLRPAAPPSPPVDPAPAALSDWRDAVLARVREMIGRADAGVTETVKWRKPSNGMAGVPVWERAGIICTGETYRNRVKLTFARGATLPDPAGLFNASLDGGTRRAIDIAEDHAIDQAAFVALIRAAVAANLSRGSGSRSARSA